MKTKGFNLSEKIVYYGAVSSGRVIQEEDVKEFIRLLKDRINNLFDEQRKSQGVTNNPEVISERLNKANLIYGNDGIFENIDKIVGKALI